MSTKSRFRTSRRPNLASQLLRRGDRPLGIEPLENRWVLAAVSWDGGGDGVNWTDGLNWSNNVVPTNVDDVTINLGGTITHASGSHTIRSLTSTQNLTLSGGSITVTTGASSISGTLAISNLASLTANGATAVFTASGAVTLNGASLFAQSGGKLNLTTATSYAEQPSNGTFIRADGASSKIDLSGITSVTGASGSLFIDALNGGNVEMDSLVSTSARDVNINADSAASVMNLAALTSATDTTLLSSITISNGATFTAPLATYVGGSVLVTNSTVSFPSLTNFDTSSIFNGANGSLTLPNLTSYAEPTSAGATWRANGANSKIDLTSITSITGTTGNLFIEAQAGGTIELDGLPSTTARDVNFQVDGATSVLNLSALTSATDVTLLSSLTVSNGGTLTSPLLATYSGGSIVLENKTLSIPSLTNFNSSSIFNGANGNLTLPNLTSYTEPPSAGATWRANGANSKIDLTSITSITGATGNLFIEALNGGTIELDGLPSTTARDINFSVDGATSVLNLSALTSASDTTLLSSLAISNGGTLMSPVFATYSGGSIFVDNKTLSIPSLANINSSSIFTGANGILTLPNVTSYAEPPSAGATWRANGANSKIDLTSITAITGATGNLFVEALNGGTIELDGLPSTTARDINFSVDGATSVLNLSALTSASDTTLLSSVSLANGGTLIAPVWTAYNAGSIFVSGMTATLSTLTNINFSSLFTGVNGILSLPNVTSYAEPPSAGATWRANGANSKIDLTPIISVTGATGNVFIEALAGGTVEVDSLASTTARDFNLSADGVGSLVNASSLTTWNDATGLGTLAVANSGTVTLKAATDTLTGVTVVASSNGTINASALVLSTSSPLFGAGGTVVANVTSNQLTSPGLSPGRVTVTGNFVQGPSANFISEITGLTVATQYDQLKVNGTVSLAGNLTLNGSYVANVGDTFTIIDNDGADAVIGTFDSSPEGDIYTFNGRPLRLSYQGGDGNDVTLTRVNNLDVNRRLFYNESFYDGNNPAINASDDAAIDPSKVAYLPGSGPSTWANISGYDKGINGIVIDISGTGNHAGITVNDFIFKVGNNNSPTNWAVAPAPTSVSVRLGAGYRGADRIEITWATGAITKKWLEVAVLPTAQTGLGASGKTVDPDGPGVGTPVAVGDVFFFGNAVGGSGDGDTVNAAPTNAADELGSRNNPHNLANPALVTDVYDYNKNRFVDANDQLIARNNATNLATQLIKINITSTVGPYAPESDGDAGIASALAASRLNATLQSGAIAPPQILLPESSAGAQPLVDVAPSLQQAAAASYFAALSSSPDDSVDAAVDDELAHELAAKLATD
jgi:hypothetical protein